MEYYFEILPKNFYFNSNIKKNLNASSTYHVTWLLHSPNGKIQFIYYIRGLMWIKVWKKSILKTFLLLETISILNFLFFLIYNIFKFFVNNTYNIFIFNAIFNYALVCK